MEIENIKLDKNNVVFNQAADFIRHTDKNIFLTGRAGTGKTTFLKYIRQTTEKKVVVLAPTGVAAINAGGQTVHSFFHIGKSIYPPHDTRLRINAPKNDTDQRIISDHFRYGMPQLDLIRSLELLVIDEISMLRCDLIDVIDKLLRWIRDREDEPFGGVQMLLIGDTFQLPPIATNEEWKILKAYYDSPFFFDSQVVREYPLIYIELKEIYRQKDRQFIDLLNNIRINQVNETDKALLQSRYLPDFQPSETLPYITLTTHNRIVGNINQAKLMELPGEEKIYKSVITGVFPDDILPADKTLHLKTNAQVMFVKNNLPSYYNGSMGKIVQIKTDGLLVELSTGSLVEVKIMEWENIRYSWNRMKNKVEEEIIGTFLQYPIRLAWAITVHKSQGLTFEHVIADVGAAFTHGQVYVALSRCTNLEGLVLHSKITDKAIQTNPQALLYARNETSEAYLAQILEEAKIEYQMPKTNARPLGLQSNMTIHELFETMNEYFNDTTLSFTMLSSKLKILLSNNTTILAETINSLEWSNMETVVLLFLFHLFVNVHKEWVTLSDLETLFDNKQDYRRLQLLMLNQEHVAFIENYISSVKTLNETAFCLTQRAKEIFLFEILPETKKIAPIENQNIDANQTKDANQIIDYKTINEKILFYNPQECEQIASLVKLLDENNFLEVQKRLSAAGMRKGFACIFYGAPGTGKTETVYQIARQTKRNIFLVNISETKSIWFGESEKKIKEVFMQYKVYVSKSKIAPILLFNEADAVIGKRLENVRHSVDQTTNTIQNIILQEIENLDGIMIATTNLTQNLDAAFERRFLYKIKFQKPSVETRKEIWQTFIPSLSPEESSEMAEMYDFSGGEVENIARKYTIENIIQGAPLSIAGLHRLCKEEKLLNYD
jgi:AAA+ superfamily predicted ATPase